MTTKHQEDSRDSALQSSAKPLRVSHTAAPWHAMEPIPKSFSDHGFREVARCMKGTVIYAEAARMWVDGAGFCWGSGDAKLIAAAPDLLEALLKAREELAALPHSLGYEFTHLRMIDAAIAKAQAQ